MELLKSELLNSDILKIVGEKKGSQNEGNIFQKKLK